MDTFEQIKAQATEDMISRLARHGIPEAEARQWLQAAWNAPAKHRLPTLEELDAMPDGPDISDDDMEAWLETDAAQLAASWAARINCRHDLRATDVIEYDDLTDKQKQIVDAGNQIADMFPEGLHHEQLAKLILDEVAKAQAGEYRSKEAPPTPLTRKLRIGCLATTALRLRGLTSTGRTARWYSATPTISAARWRFGIIHACQSRL